MEPITLEATQKTISKKSKDSFFFWENDAKTPDLAELVKARWQDGETYNDHLTKTNPLSPRKIDE